MRWLYRLLSVLGDYKSATRGPGSYIKRQLRKRAHRSLAQVLRRLLR